MTILDTLHAAWDAHGPLPIAFDGDGTLWTGDVAEEVWHALLAEQRVRPEAHTALVREAERAGLDPSGDVHALCSTLYRAYVDGTFDEERICEVQARAFAGWTRAEMDEFVDRVLFAQVSNAKGQPSLRERYIGETCTIAHAAQARGVPVFVVSASPAHVVERAVRPLGISRVLGSRVLWDGERVAADVERPICYGPGKVRALEKVLEGAPLLAAFGDNVFDVQMLQYARTGYLVRPKPRLLALPASAAFARLPELRTLPPLSA